MRSRKANPGARLTCSSKQCHSVASIPSFLSKESRQMSPRSQAKKAARQHEGVLESPFLGRGLAACNISDHVSIYLGTHQLPDCLRSKRASEHYPNAAVLSRRLVPQHGCCFCGHLFPAFRFDVCMRCRACLSACLPCEMDEMRVSVICERAEVACLFSVVLPAILACLQVCMQRMHVKKVARGATYLSDR
jgi:hypothetical protein